MPFGLSWSRYISLITLSFLSMAGGAQFVHVIYMPLDDLDDLIEEAVQKRLQEREEHN